jgi:hypothetical protein
MGASIDPLLHVAPVEHLNDETPRRHEPAPAPLSSPTTAPLAFTAMVEEKAAEAAAAHPATGPLMQLEVEAHEGSFQAQQLVAKYATEQAAEDADARKALTQRAHDDATESKVVAQHTDGDAAAQQVVTEHANEDAAAEAAEAATKEHFDVTV